MSILLNAPLIEVVFEIKWNSNSNDELNKFQILIGSLYSELKDSYSNPISLIPDPNIPINIFLNKPTHRFINLKDKNVLYQIGPGILSVNHVGSNYEWDSFIENVNQVVTAFQKLFTISASKPIDIKLKYLDFFEFDSNQINTLDYLKDKLNINIQSTVLKEKPSRIGFATSCKVGDFEFAISLNSGNIKRNSIEQSGLLLESSMNKVSFISGEFNDWNTITTESHQYLSQFFKEITKGDLYNSFNK